MIFSRKKAPPPPLIRHSWGSTSSAPSIVTSICWNSSSVVSGMPRLGRQFARVDGRRYAAGFSGRHPPAPPGNAPHKPRSSPCPGPRYPRRTRSACSPARRLLFRMLGSFHHPMSTTISNRWRQIGFPAICRRMPITSLRHFAARLGLLSIFLLKERNQRKKRIRQTGDLLFDDFFVDAVACFEILQPNGIGMRAKAADQRVHRKKFGKTEKSHPQLEVAGAAPRIVHAGAGAIPQTAPPERGLLLNIAIGASQKPPPRPPPQMQNFHRHAFVGESGGASGDPLHVGEGLERRCRRRTAIPRAADRLR